MPCMNDECVKKDEALTLGQTADSYCTICYTEGLGAGPCVQLQCKHIFHLDCIMSKVKQKWGGKRIVFAFMECPGCNAKIQAPNCPVLE